MSPRSVRDAARAHEGDLRPGGLRGDREVADERPLHAVEELDHLRRDPAPSRARGRASAGRAGGSSPRPSPRGRCRSRRGPGTRRPGPGSRARAGAGRAAPTASSRAMTSSKATIERLCCGPSNSATARASASCAACTSRWTASGTSAAGCGGRPGGRRADAPSEERRRPDQGRRRCRTHGVTPASDSAAPAPPGRRRRGRRRWRRGRGPGGAGARGSRSSRGAGPGG